jgi:hypothetical protein
LIVIPIYLTLVFDRKLAKKYKIQTSETVYRDINVYNNAGKSVSTKFALRFSDLVRKATANRDAGPFRSMILEAQKYWDELSDEYDGSENIMDVMAKFGYIERDELDAFIRWINVDYEYTFKDISLLNFYDEKVIIGRNYSVSFVVDQRGFLTILTNYVKDNKIPDPKFGVRVRYDCCVEQY